MRELDFLNIIKHRLSDSSFIGDDCAYLDDFDMFVTQDSLIEDVHFSMYTTNPYFLGRKSVNVNLSDLAAALALPKYISVSLSLPKSINDSFVDDFYRGINDVCNEFSVKVIGGDITSSDKIFISVTAIGKRHSLFFSSRKFARKGDLIVVTGDIGSSAAGLYALSNFLYCNDYFVSKHINPTARLLHSKLIADLTDSNIAAMDTSDGLVDALFKIAVASKHSLKIDINKVPINSSIVDFSLKNNLDYKDFIKWGGEDYELLFCLPQSLFAKLDHNLFTCIGSVLNKDPNPSVFIQDDSSAQEISKEIFEARSFNHF